MVQPAVRTQDQSNGKLKFADYTTEKMAQYTKTGWGGEQFKTYYTATLKIN